jgi:peptide/nickel transport system substrate-binding protein
MPLLRERAMLDRVARGLVPRPEMAGHEAPCHGARHSSAVRLIGVIAVATILLVSCAPAAPNAQPGNSAPAATPRERVLTASIEIEPNFIAGLAPLFGGVPTDFYQRMFNAFLDLYDEDDQPRPYLAEALPQLNTESWVVFPDGKMETHYRLKPNLVWHDGHPLTAHDFVFTYQNATPAVGFRTGIAPFNQMEAVTASDDRTLTIRWKNLYPDAAVLLQGATRFGLVPFPRHLLEQTFVGAVPQTVQESPYWDREFVGAGPYKLSRWELGSFLEATAFDQHVLGRPKIDRIRLMFMKDQNAAFASMLAGSTDMALNTIRFEHAMQLKREWASSQKGTVGIHTVSQTAAYFQHRPEYATPAVRDVRVRRAFAHAFDKQTFSDTIWAGELAVLDTIFDPRVRYYPTIERAITKYPFDLAASERLMNEAGYRKGADGFYVGPEGRPSFTIQSPADRPELPVLDANWRTAGFDTHQQALPPMDAADSEVRSTFSAMSISPSGTFEVQQTSQYRSSEVTTPANRWRGENRGGWTHPEYDRLVNVFNVTVDPEERIQQRAQMARILTEELPSIMLAPNPNPYAYLNTVKNVGKMRIYTTGRLTWNIERWEI